MRDSIEELPIRLIYNAKSWPYDGAAPNDTHIKWHNSVIEKTPSELSPYDVVECLINRRFVDTAIETGLYYLTENVLSGEYPGNILNLLSELDKNTLMPYADVLKGILTGAHAALAVSADNNDVWHDERIWQMFNVAVQKIMSTIGFSADVLTASGESADIGSGWKTAEAAAVEERDTWHAPQFDSEGNCPPEFRRYINSLGIEYIVLYGDDKDYWKYDAAVTGFHGASEILNGDNGLYKAVKDSDTERINSILARLKQAPRDLILPVEPPAYVNTAEQVHDWQINMGKVKDLLEKEYFTSYYLLPIMEPDRLLPVLDMLGKEYVIFFDTTPVEEDPSLEPAAKETIRLCVDKLTNLRRIFVYNEDMDKAGVMNLLEYPRQKGIDVQVPGNHYKMLKTMETIRKSARKDSV